MLLMGAVEPRVWAVPQTRDQVPSSPSRPGGMRIREKVREVTGVKAIAIKAIALTQNQ